MKTYFTVTPHQGGSGQGYDISIGLGKKYRAVNLQEVITALNHYYNPDVKELAENPQCPLCRATQQEMARKGR